MPEYGSINEDPAVPLLTGIGNHEGGGEVEGGFEACFLRYTGKDPDDVFAYSTPKVTRIRSWQLGVISYSLKLLILFYIVGFNLLYMRNYMKWMPIDGGSVLSSIYTIKPNGMPHYCCQCDSVTGVPVDPSTCTEGKACCLLSDPNVPTSISPRESVTSPDSVSFVTRFNYQRTDTYCATQGSVFPISDDCVQTAVKSKPFFVGGVESYSIGLQHGVASVTFANVVTNNNMVGALLDQYGNVIKTFDDTPNGNRVDGFDVFSVQDVLTACGIQTLDERSNRTTTDHSLREAGFTVLFYIEYTQTGSDPQVEGGLQYTYLPKPMRQVQFKTVTTIGPGELTPLSATIDRSAPRSMQLLTAICHCLLLDPHHKAHRTTTCSLTML
jgi:hypothetical protein